MAIDLVCGQCDGRLLAEEPGSVVACPHCGAHLQVPSEDVTEVPSGVIAEPLVAAASSANESASEEFAAAAPIAADVEVALSPALPEQDAMLTVASGMVGPPPVTGDEITASDDITLSSDAAADDITSTDTTSFGAAPAEMKSFGEMPTASFAVPPIDWREAGVTNPPAVIAETVAAPVAEPVAATVSVPIAAADTVPRFWFLIAVSYASAVTLAFLFLLVTLGRWRSHPLENLPDVVPKVQNGEVALEVAPPDADVPRGHVLPLGESRRFGSLLVTPLRVTQGTLQFEHKFHDPDATRMETEPVLKLWLRFENISRNQTFAPLDSLLLFKRHYQDLGRVLTNQFLCRADQRRNDGDLHHVYELSSSSEFQITGQHLDVLLGPGDSVEMFVPSEENIDDLTGELVWRVQFRKGYNPRTRHGVTTVIDVPFQRRDVQIET